MNKNRERISASAHTGFKKALLESKREIVGGFRGFAEALDFMK